jgi:hypothetical protein
MDIHGTTTQGMLWTVSCAEPEMARAIAMGRDFKLTLGKLKKNGQMKSRLKERSEPSGLALCWLGPGPRC